MADFFIAELAFLRNESENSASITSQHRQPVARLQSLGNTAYMLSGFKLKIEKIPARIRRVAPRSILCVAIFAGFAFCGVNIFVAPAKAAPQDAQVTVSQAPPAASNANSAPITHYTLSP